MESGSEGEGCLVRRALHTLSSPGIGREQSRAIGSPRSSLGLLKEGQGELGHRIESMDGRKRLIAAGSRGEERRVLDARAWSALMEWSR